LAAWGVVLASGDPPPAQVTHDAGEAATSESAESAFPQQESGFRTREGTEMLGQLGCFRRAGDRLVFTPAGSHQQLIALENLNLERIARVIADNPERLRPLEWNVTGTVTEFRGDNYLFVRRASLRSRVQNEYRSE
jgi:hypothetical protein